LTYSLLELAAAFIQTGELDDALAALDQHLENDPADNRARRMRIRVLRHLGQFRRALADFDLLADQTPDDIHNHSVLLRQAGNLDGAIDSLAAACERWPENERLAERYVQLLIEDGQYEAALPVVQRQPHNWRWLGWEGDLLAQMGDDVAATARYGLALAHLGEQPDPWLAPMRARLLLARAHAYRRLELFDQAAAHYRAAEDIVPDDPLIPFLRGLVCFLQGDLQAAIALCRPVFTAANDALHQQMLDELQNDARHAGLLAAIEGGP